MEKHVYLCRGTEGAGRRWVIAERRTAPDGPSDWRVVSAGSPSLAVLLPAAFERYATMAASSLTFSSRLFEDIQTAPPSSIPPAIVNAVFPDLQIGILVPEHEGADRWAHLLRSRGEISLLNRFRPQTLHSYIANVFGPPNVDRLATDLLIESERLRRIDTHKEKIELWIRPAWTLASCWPNWRSVIDDGLADPHKLQDKNWLGLTMADLYRMREVFVLQMAQEESGQS